MYYIIMYIVVLKSVEIILACSPDNRDLFLNKIKYHNTLVNWKQIIVTDMILSRSAI